jgi:hypothetical protein
MQNPRLWNLASVPRKQPTDPPAANMRQHYFHQLDNDRRPPLVERMVGNENLTTSSNSCGFNGSNNKLPLKKQPQQLQPSSYPHQYATPNHDQKRSSAVVSATSYATQRQGTTKQTPAVGFQAKAPFKSPTTLCFERMLGAGKSNKYMIIGKKSRRSSYQRMTFSFLSSKSYCSVWYSNLACLQKTENRSSFIN